ncbi:radical SAM family heme chaperone HemW [Spelaeicoccus albus]|uniref:Heme chaperone HemW n=1 Tax=Spelaeicoccus albus TaxID=1280376 RepID=A0A7Z0IIS5_9MICO|nr:radical SAM family heme chaperone HemW [Spelaeicoccus albus]NYI68691.1 oxygen-independent coproporphyrinogen-3 oxidase [Spelaeicoccus albus]
MSPSLPDGLPVPDDGALPPGAAEGASSRPLSLYVHIPFCSVRCGYCDFNTYTAAELGGGASQNEYADTAAGEIVFADGVLTAAGIPRRSLDTVFFGGGTPTLLPTADLARLLGVARRRFGLAPEAEITTEANPDSVTAESLRELADAGFTRVSFGMQSAVRHVLKTLDRTHDPDRIPHVVRWAREAGLNVSLDLIYGTPGESVDDWQRSIDAALACGPDHISAYSLIVEEGTKLGRDVRRGVVPAPDEDDLAVKYELADAAFRLDGLQWYEVSNWAREPGQECRHNLNYWLGADWWGIGPGAHSHVGGVRWWNVKHPRPYAARLAAGTSPAAGREILDASTRRMEKIMLEIRLNSGLDVEAVSEGRRAAVPSLVEDGLIDAGAAATGRIVLTDRGRLLADAVVRTLVD